MTQERQKDAQQNEVDGWIADYLADTLDPDTLGRLKEWTARSDEHRRYVRERMELWFSAGAAGSTVPFDAEKAYERFRQRTASAARGRKSLRLAWRPLLRAAAVLLLIVLPLAGYWQGQRSVRRTFARMEVEAPQGSRTRLTLPDGTLVWLNAGSRISYSQGFGTDERSLTLTGEGYFEVSHNPALPFTVHTREVDLRVLGTKFNFKNYPNDTEATVHLLEGKVALHNGLRPMPELHLAPGEKMVLDKHTGRMARSESRAGNAVLWTRDELFFDEELLQDIAKKLMRSYNARIEIADSLKGRRFYGSFKVMGNTLDEVLETIARTNRMKYRYEGGTYILY